MNGFLTTNISRFVATVRIANPDERDNNEKIIKRD